MSKTHPPMQRRSQNAVSRSVLAAAVVSVTLLGSLIVTGIGCSSQEPCTGGAGTPPPPAAEETPAPADPAVEAPAEGASPPRAGAAMAGDSEGDNTSFGKREYILPTSPKFRDERVDLSAGEIEVLEFLRLLADYTGLPVIIDSTNPAIKTRMIIIPAPMRDVSGDIIVGILKANRFLVSREVLPNGEVVLTVQPGGPMDGAVPTHPPPTPIIPISKTGTLVARVEPGFENVSSDEIATIAFTLKHVEPRNAIQSLEERLGERKGTARSKALSIVAVQNSMVVIVTAKFGLLKHVQELLKTIDIDVEKTGAG